MTPKSKLSAKPNKIGHETIYPQQWEVAEEVRKILLEGSRTPIVLLQFQSGKTGAMIAIIYNFIKDCEAKKKTFQVIALCGLPHLDLAEQTRSRMTSGMKNDGHTRTGALLHSMASNTELHCYPNELMEKGIIVQHNSVTLKNMPLCDTPNVDERLIIIDEVHSGNVKDGNIDSFLRNCGVFISEQIHTWEKKNGTNTRVVGVSATPFAQMILSNQFAEALLSEEESLRHRPEKKVDVAEMLFSFVYREPGSGYNSLANMMKNGRLKQVEALFSKNEEPSTFLKMVDQKFRVACKETGPGYLVVRATGRQHNLLADHLTQKGSVIEIKMFDNINGNISELNNFLSRQPVKPTWVLIRGAMRAGMTLGDNFIRGWVETGSKQVQVDALTQAGVGRACGYNRTEQYPIYCDLAKAQQGVDYFQGLRDKNLKAVPPGIQNRGVRFQRNRGIGATPVTVTYEEALARIRLLPKPKTSPGKKKVNDYQILSTNGNETNDIAAILLQDGPHARSTYGYRIRGASQKFKASYAQLIKKHPDWVGKVVLLRDLAATANLPEEGAESLHKRRSALRKDQPRRAR